MMDRDNITRTGARAPGVERLYRLHGGGNGRYATSTQSEKLWRGAATAKDGRKPQGKARLISRPWSRTGENPPYGILGGAMETSASFEARSAPSSYPIHWIWRNP